MANFQGQRNLDRNKVFWSKISRGNWNNCWEFRGAIGNNGYGKFWNGNKIIQAHRFAYESYYGHKIPLGKLVLHKCDNRACCNPSHLYLGTQLDNMRDMILRGRLVRNSYKSACTKAKFYAGKIWLIRRLKNSDRRLSEKI